jgi:hypothetical protein
MAQNTLSLADRPLVKGRFRGSSLRPFREVPELDRFSAHERKMTAASTVRSNALVLLAEDLNVDVRIAVALNPHTPAATLSLLATDDLEVRRSVARNSSLVAETLSVLSRANEDAVLAHAAKHSQTLVKDLDELAKVRFRNVRLDVAENTRTSKRTLNRLAKDEDPDVRAAVAANLSTSEEVRFVLVSDVVPAVRAAVAKTSGVASLLRTLSEDSDNGVVVAALQNSFVPVDVREKLAKNRSNRVRRAAGGTFSPQPQYGYVDAFRF